MKKRESLIEKNLRKEVESLGGITYKLSPIGRVNKPDRLVMLPGGVVIFVECKAPGEKPRPGQLREHARLRKLGFRVVILDSYDVSFCKKRNVRNDEKTKHGIRET